MRTRSLGAFALLAGLLAVTGVRPAAAQVQEESVQINAVGRVQSVADRDTFTLQVRRMNFRVNVEPRLRISTNVRPGDRVRVAGEMTDPGQIDATSVQVLGRGPGPIDPGPGGGVGGGRPWSGVSGTIQSVDRQNRTMIIRSSTGNTRVEFDDDTLFYRDRQQVTLRDFRVGDEVRAIGSRRGGDFVARRIFSGARRGWQNGESGEIVGLDSRNREIEVNFDGAVYTVRLANAAIRRGNQRLDLNDLRLDQEVRVTGTARGGQAIDATLVEIVRGRGGDDGGVIRPGREVVREGRVVNVAAGRQTFRIEARGEDENEIRFLTDDRTTFTRGGARATFNALRDGVRVRVTAVRQGEDWLATRVEILN